MTVPSIYISIINKNVSTLSALDCAVYFDNKNDNIITIDLCHRLPLLTLITALHKKKCGCILIFYTGFKN